MTPTIENYRDSEIRATHLHTLSLSYNAIVKLRFLAGGQKNSEHLEWFARGLLWWLCF
jgi:hypothetical protein